MGLALFDGPRPVATWAYKLIEATSAKQASKGGASRKTKRAGGKASKRPEHADELLGAWPYNRPCAQQYVGKYQSCMVTSGQLIVHAPVVTVNTGKRMKRLSFSTEFAAELNALIKERLKELLRGTEARGTYEDLRCVWN